MDHQQTDGTAAGVGKEVRPGITAITAVYRKEPTIHEGHRVLCEEETDGSLGGLRMAILAIQDHLDIFRNHRRESDMHFRHDLM